MLVGVGSFLGLSLGARAADRGHGSWSVSASLCLLAVAAGVHFLELTGGAPPGWPTWVVVAAAFITQSTSLFSVMPVIQSRLVESAPASAPLALALNGSAASIGQACGAALGGTMLTVAGGPGIPLAAGSAALAAAALWWIAGRPAALAAERTAAAAPV
jgi:predicted MFS family arabinose efflux permease